MIRLLPSLSGLVAILIAAPVHADDGTTFFEKRIRPALATHCYKCHSGDVTDPKGGLRVDTRSGIRNGGERSPAIVPGKPGKSLLLKAIRHETLEMPRKAKKLPDDVIADFEKWIAMGAPDPRDAETAAKSGIDWGEASTYWAFQPVNPETPTVRNSAWAWGEIDRYILAGIERQNLQIAGEAPLEAVLRRLSYDLTGLPPTAEEVESVLQRATRMDRQKLLGEEVDRLLASKQFGVHFGRLWLDGVRFRTRIQAMRHYRNYVVDSFNADKPYDRLLREHIAGDLMVEDRPDGTIDYSPVIGTASLVLAVGGCDITERQIELIGQTFLGVTLSCARCHDHKFDPFTQKDYYALAGILQSSEMEGEKGGGIPLLGTVSAREAHRANVAIELRLRKEYEQLRKRLPEAVQLAELQEELERKDSDRQRERIKKLLATRDKKDWDPDPPEMPRIRELIKERRAISQKVRNVPVTPGLQEGKPKDVPVLRNGEKSQAGEIVPRRFPVILSGHEQQSIGERTAGSGRLELANWLTSPENPLTARVMANRVWLWLMGEGIVRTPNDFGKTGEAPTHPELLDYLAHRLIELDWSVKELAREIVLSRTYGLSVAAPQAVRLADPLNQTWSRARMRRLRYEQIIDTLYAVGGQLELDPAAEHLDTHKPPKEPRIRTLYYGDQGDKATFDGADEDLLVAQRDESITAPQMLYLLNSRTVKELAQALAKRVTGGDDRIAQLYLICFARLPGDSEIEQANAFLADNPLERFCHALLCTNEFIYLH